MANFLEKANRLCNGPLRLGDRAGTERLNGDSVNAPTWVHGVEDCLLNIFLSHCHVLSRSGTHQQPWFAVLGSEAPGFSAPCQAKFMRRRNINSCEADFFQLFRKIISS